MANISSEPYKTIKVNMVRATISADIISSTSLSVEELTLLQSEIHSFLDELSEKSQENDWGRLFKGDSVEIFLHDPHEALRVALLLKTLVKKTFAWGKENNARRELFRKYGIRLAIGIGEMRIADQKQDILDGEAIYNSGRLLEKASKEKLSIKRSMFFACPNPLLTEYVDVMVGLLDTLLRNATSRQNEILYYRLLGKNEKEIAGMLDIKQSAVNQRSNSAGWKAVESALNYYEKLNFEQ
ncbi:MAG: RNA polymerase subunit sigma-70 [Bacteroidales bacterium]|nr:RNA polymerase subunit sigma-70 [Bacteroidales bacterium]